MTEQTAPATIAALLKDLRASPHVYAETAAAMIEVLRAERDAALARVELEHAARDMLRAEGARQERAAIVAWLLDRHYWNAKRSFSRRWFEWKLRFANVMAARIMFDLSGAVGRGEHLKGTDHE